MKGEPVMPNPTPDPGVDEWVLASAAEVARNVARHGVPITWSEAAERLRRTVELLSGQVFVIDDGGTFTPLPQQDTPRWQETGFAESVACEIGRGSRRERGCQYG